MEKIQTAENLLRNEFCEGEFDEIMECLNGSIEPSLVRAMKEFAKLHVEQALKEASEKFDHYSNKNAILGSYPLSNIK
jgi:hypothetical protein